MGTSSSSGGCGGGAGPAVSPEAQEAEQTDGGRGPKKPSRTGRLTAPELQSGSTSASYQPPDGSGHRPRAARGHRLIGPSVADVQEVGVDVAESDADLLPLNVAAVADGPGPKAGEDLVVGADKVAFLAGGGAPEAERKHSFFVFSV